MTFARASERRRWQWKTRWAPITWLWSVPDNAFGLVFVGRLASFAVQQQEIYHFFRVVAINNDKRVSVVVCVCQWKKGEWKALCATPVCLLLKISSNLVQFVFLLFLLQDHFCPRRCSPAQSETTHSSEQFYGTEAVSKLNENSGACEYKAKNKKHNWNMCRCCTICTIFTEHWLSIERRKEECVLAVAMYACFCPRLCHLRGGEQFS